MRTVPKLVHSSNVISLGSRERRACRNADHKPVETLANLLILVEDLTEKERLNPTDDLREESIRRLTDYYRENF